MYAIVKTGGKQYRVEQGMSLLVERLRADEGAKVALDPLLFVDGEKVIDGDGVKVEAKVVGHERGPKLRIVKFKPKRGYKRRTGHRQELTRIEGVGIKLEGGRSKSRRVPKAEKSASATEEPAPVRGESEADVGAAGTSGTESSAATESAAASGAESSAATESAAASGADSSAA